jgi:hypothetical protein
MVIGKDAGAAPWSVRPGDTVEIVKVKVESTIRTIRSRQKGGKIIMATDGFLYKPSGDGSSGYEYVKTETPMPQLEKCLN